MLSLNADLNARFTELASQSLDNRTLSDRERALSVLAVAVALEDNNAIKQTIVAAKQAGVTNDEIGHISSIVIAMRGLQIAGLGAVVPAASNGQSAQSTCCR
jgi:alkylhydroperoxidase/carboxymuconolactone decarboxylase family protein YurZ